MSDVIRVDSLSGAGELVKHDGPLLAVPEPGELVGGGISIREARPGDGLGSDIAFIDALQKKNTKAVGFMFTKTLEGHIAKGHVPRERVGYCIGVDKYFKREDVGIIYQMNITPGNKRRLVAASLLKAMFDRESFRFRV